MLLLKDSLYLIDLATTYMMYKGHDPPFIDQSLFRSQLRSENFKKNNYSHVLVISSNCEGPGNDYGTDLTIIMIAGVIIHQTNRFLFFTYHSGKKIVITTWIHFLLHIYKIHEATGSELFNKNDFSTCGCNCKNMVCSA